MSKKSDIIIYQAKNGAIELQKDLKDDTIWGSLDQIALLFERDKSVISRHIKNIFRDKELKENSVVAKNATTASDGKTYQVTHYNLDMIISIGYRVNSKTATKFRQWATKILHSHITKGYTINPSRIEKNYEIFMKAVEDIKKLASKNAMLKTDDVLELVKTFANTWFSLESYDKSSLPHSGVSKKQVEITGEELSQAIQELKNELINK